MKKLIAALVLSAAALPAQNYIGRGHTTATCLDFDSDGYGTGVGCPNGPDANDYNASINTAATIGSLTTWFADSTKGYTYSPAGVVYISPSGNNSTCARLTTPFTYSNASACLDFATAQSKASGGDAIVWRAGTYNVTSNFSLSKSGTDASHPTILMSYPGELVTINATGQHLYMIVLNTVNYVTLDGLKLTTDDPDEAGIQDINSGSMQRYGHTIRNMEIIGWRWQYWENDALDGLLIEHNSFHDVISEHNIYIGANYTPVLNMVIQDNLIYNAQGGHNIHNNGPITNPIFRRNILYNNHSDCLNFQNGTTGALIENNVMWGSTNAPIEFSDYPDSNPGIFSWDQTGNVIRYNTVLHTGWDYTSGGSGADVCAYGWAPLHNYDNTPAVAGPNQGGVHNGGNPHSFNPTTYDSNVIYNNCPGNATLIFHRNYTTGTAQQNSVTPTNAASWIKTFKFTNNIAYNPSPGNFSWFLYDPTSTSVYRTSTQLFGTDTNASSGNVVADPLFTTINKTTPSSMNLIPRTGSPAIGAGNASNKPTTDIRGITRGSSPTVGAYEIAPPTGTPPTITSTSPLPGGTTGTAYSYQFTATGDTGGNCTGCSWSATGVPSGLSLSGTGLLSGTPSAGGTSTISVSVSNSAGSAGPTGFSITIATPPPATVNGVYTQGVMTGGTYK